MSQYAVIGTTPVVDTSILVGPFRSEEKAREADEELMAKGYNTEICQLFSVDEIDTTDWSDA